MHRRHACCWLETTAALSALSRHIGREEEPGAPPNETDSQLAATARGRTVQALVTVLLGPAVDSSRFKEASLLGLVSGLMVSHAGAAALTPLVQQLLPPTEPAEQQAAGLEPTAEPELPQESEVFQARVLALRKCCAHLGCPFVSVGSDSSSGADGSPLVPRGGKKCAGCLTVRFCCTDCARAAWPTHKRACRALAAQRAKEAA